MGLVSFHDLDFTLRALLKLSAIPGGPLGLGELKVADISFETPARSYDPKEITLNLFLYEIKENRELRDPVPIYELGLNGFERRRPPIRVDCTYMVTAWSPEAGADKIREEHALLCQALLWLNRFPTIPASYANEPIWSGTMLTQPYVPPTMVAQMDGARNLGEFWASLENPPRPSFNLIVTVAIDLLDPVVEGPPVITKEVHLKAMRAPGEVEPTLFDGFQVGGVVRDAASGNPIAGAAVEVVETGQHTVTDDEGRYNFILLDTGTYRIHVAAPGFPAADQLITVPRAAVTDPTYDVPLTP